MAPGSIRIKVDHASKILFNQYSPFSAKERVRMLFKGVRSTDAISAVINEHIRIDKATKLKYFKIGEFKLFFYLDTEGQDQYTVADLCNAASKNIEITFAISDFLHRHVRPSEGDIVFDLGANIGTYSLMLSEMVGTEGRVFAFEPITSDILSYNIKANNVKNIEVIPAAVSDVCGSAEIEIADSFLGSSLVHNHSSPLQSPTLRVEAPTTTIDAFCLTNDIRRVDFIKMNIEGAEGLALLGAQETIRKSHPMWSIASTHLDHRRERQHPKLIDFLKANNYTIFEQPDWRIWAFYDQH